MTRQQRTHAVAETHASLAAQFAARFCRCGAVAVCVAPGREAVRSESGILLQRAARDRNFCLAHAPGLRAEGIAA